MKEPAGYYATWNKPQRETQILDGITSKWNMKKKKIKDHRNKESGEVVAKGWEGGEIRRG